MRSLVLASAATVGLLAFGEPANAQVMFGTGQTVIGTRGLPPGPFTSGYYSPYPGALYSPFAQPQRVNSFVVGPRFVTPVFSSGFIDPRFNFAPGFRTFPSGGFSGRSRFNRW
jgi:hypothetical protein